MIDVLGRLLNELEEVHRESEIVVCQTVQVRPGRADLCLEEVKVLY